MAKEKKEVHQPDDRFFREVMQKKRNAIAYIQTFAPAWEKVLDLQSLHIQKETFTVPDLKTFDADILYKCRFKNSKEELTISFLWENKSRPDNFISIQLGLYLFISYYKQVKNGKKKLEPIIPLIFYNGKKDWQPKRVTELFAAHPFFAEIEPFLPDFGFNFTNVTKVPQEQLQQIKTDFFRSAMISMALRNNWRLLEQNFSVIFDFDDEDEDIKISLGYYVLGIMERLPKNIKVNMENLAPKAQINMKSTLAMLLKQGRLEGRAEERTHGIKFADLVNDVEKVLLFTTELPDLPMSKVVALTNKSENFIKKIQKGFSGGNEKKARKVVTELFKEYGELEMVEKERLEKVFSTYLPKFKRT
jgi:hypothetical protein